MSAEQDKDPVHRTISIWSTGDAGTADRIYGPDYVNHQHLDQDD